MVSLAATYNLSAFPAARVPSKSRAECAVALEHYISLSLAVSRCSTHVPACSIVPQLIRLALRGGFAGAGGRIEKLPLPRALRVMQAMAALGTTCKHSKELTSLIVRQAPQAINSAVVESLRCRQPQVLLQLTWWDWVRYCVPIMGLRDGLAAASMAPAPLQHTRGLAVVVEAPQQHNHTTNAGALRSLAVPTSASYRDRRCLPWSVHTVAGVHTIVDSMTLLLHALLTVRLYQAHTDEADAVAPDVFADKIRAVLTKHDRQVFVCAYGALAAFAAQRPMFPLRLLMVDRVARSLRLLDAVPGPATPARSDDVANVSDASLGGSTPGTEHPAGHEAQSRVRREWAALAVSPALFEAPEAKQLGLACMQRVDPAQPSLRVQLERVLVSLGKVESSGRGTCPLKQLKQLPKAASDERVVEGIIAAKRGAGDDSGRTKGLVNRMRIDMLPWLCERVAESPPSVRFGSLLLRLAGSGLFPEGFRDLTNPEVSARLQRMVALNVRNQGGRSMARRQEALCQALQGAHLHMSIERLVPVQQAALLRALESDPRCADVQQHLRPARKSEGAMRSLGKVLNTQPLPLQTYQTLRELVCTAAESCGHPDHLKLAGAVVETEGGTQGGLAADLRCVIQQAYELATVAGTTKPVAGCQVTQELNRMARSVPPQALKEGALVLPAEMEEWSSATVKGSRGTPSELQVCMPHPDPEACHSLLQRPLMPALRCPKYPFSDAGGNVASTCAWMAGLYEYRLTLATACITRMGDAPVTDGGVNAEEDPQRASGDGILCNT